MRSNKKTLYLVIFCMLIVLFFIDFISNCKSFDTIGKLPESPLKSGYMTTTILSLCCELVIFILCGLGMKKIVDYSDLDERSILTCLLSAFALFMLNVAISMCVMNGKMNEIASKTGLTYNPPASLTATIVLGFMAAGILTISIFIDIDSYGKKWISMAGLVLAIVTLIPSLVDQANLETISPTITSIVFTMLILALTISIALMFFLDELDLDTPTFQTSKPTMSNARPDAALELRKLKELLDDGVISKTIYQEKAQKYIDLL